MGDTKVQPSRQPWRPWPWDMVGDRASWWLGLLLLALPGPFMGVLIGTAVSAMGILQIFWKLSPLPGIVRPAVKRFAEHWGQRVLKDPRNGPFLPHMLWLSLWVPFIFACAAYRYAHHGFELWFFFLYHFLRIGPRFRFFAHLHVLVHREGHEHRGLFRDGPLSWLNHWPMQWFVGPFFGQVPNSYGIAHNKIHHRFDNGLDDVHTNLDLDRTKLASFIMYLPRFFFYWIGISPLRYFVQHQEWVFARKLALGMSFHLALLLAVARWDPVFALAFLVFPILEAVIFFGGIAYLWHCWVDPADPTNPYVLSVTVLKGHDCIWNEDFHVVHHNQLTVHWSEAPAAFEADKQLYAAAQATIFEDTEEGTMLFWMLSGNWDELARHFVDLKGQLTHEQKKALLLKRASHILPRG